MDKLEPIKCNLYVAEYTQTYSPSLELDCVAISTKESFEDMIADIEGAQEFSIELSQKQYENMFAPLFKEIALLNQKIRELNGENV